MNEGYLPLYRKYRPQKIEDIVGQSHIKKALANAIELNKISHAYLFTGPRGTGKTSTARILAKSLNCVNGPTITPCEECESCKTITNTIPIDVIELDAASNRSVDDAREILEKVNYAPVHGKYKIYIIDEVHMLTKEAFNALLKTLEEPPKNVIFILATTESHKVMDTIKSRCQRFDFKRITTNDIIEHLRKISDKEGIKISDSALSVIAKSSAGGMRDSLSLLDQVSSLGSSEEITENDINNLLGRLSFEALTELTTHIINSDGTSAISVLEKVYNDGNEPIQILTNLMMFFKNMLIANTCDGDSALSLTNLTEEQLTEIKKLSGNLEKHQIVSLINKTADYIKELKTTTNQQLWMEVSLIDLANLTENTKLADLEARLSRLEGGGVVNIDIPKPIIKQVAAPVQTVQTQAKPETNTTKTEQVVVSIQKEAPQPTIQPSGDLKTLWGQIIDALLGANDIGGRAKMMGMANIAKYENDEMVIAVKNAIFASRFNETERRSKLITAIKQVTGKDNINLIIRERTAEDNNVATTSVVQPKKKITPPIELMQKIEESAKEEEEALEEELYPDSQPPKTNEKEFRTDLANSVCNLFEGKFID